MECCINASSGDWHLMGLQITAQLMVQKHNLFESTVMCGMLCSWTTAAVRMRSHHGITVIDKISSEKRGHPICVP